MYRGFYQRDGSQHADAYVRALWWVLALVSVRGSIRYVVLPALRRDDVLTDPTVLDGIAAGQRQAWWRLTAVEQLNGDDEGRVATCPLSGETYRSHLRLVRAKKKCWSGA